jgi:hypothetical protein
MEVDMDVATVELWLRSGDAAILIGISTGNLAESAVLCLPESTATAYRGGDRAGPKSESSVAADVHDATIAAIAVRHAVGVPGATVVAPVPAATPRTTPSDAGGQGEGPLGAAGADTFVDTEQAPSLEQGSSIKVRFTAGRVGLHLALERRQPEALSAVQHDDFATLQIERISVAMENAAFESSTANDSIFAPDWENPPKSEPRWEPGPCTSHLAVELGEIEIVDKRPLVAFPKIMEARTLSTTASPPVVPAQATATHAAGTLEPLIKLERHVRSDVLRVVGPRHLRTEAEVCVWAMLLDQLLSQFGPVAHTRLYRGKPNEVAAIAYVTFEPVPARPGVPADAATAARLAPATRALHHLARHRERLKGICAFADREGTSTTDMRVQVRQTQLYLDADFFGKLQQFIPTAVADGGGVSSGGGSGTLGASTGAHAHGGASGEVSPSAASAGTAAGASARHESGEGGGAAGATRVLTGVRWAHGAQTIHQITFVLNDGTAAHYGATLGGRSTGHDQVTFDEGECLTAISLVSKDRFRKGLPVRYRGMLCRMETSSGRVITIHPLSAAVPGEELPSVVEYDSDFEAPAGQAITGLTWDLPDASSGDATLVGVTVNDRPRTNAVGDQTHADVGDAHLRHAAAAAAVGPLYHWVWAGGRLAHRPQRLPAPASHIKVLVQEQQLNLLEDPQLASSRGISLTFDAKATVMLGDATQVVFRLGQLHVLSCEMDKRQQTQFEIVPEEPPLNLKAIYASGSGVETCTVETGELNLNVSFRDVEIVQKVLDQLNKGVAGRAEASGWDETPALLRTVAVPEMAAAQPAAGTVAAAMPQRLSLLRPVVVNVTLVDSSAGYDRAIVMASAKVVGGGEGGLLLSNWSSDVAMATSATLAVSVMNRTTIAWEPLLCGARGVDEHDTVQPASLHLQAGSAKPTWQHGTSVHSSSSVGATAHSAACMLDGDRGTCWDTGSTSGGGSRWAVVDLGAHAVVSQFRFVAASAHFPKAMALFVGPEPHRTSRGWVRCVPEGVLTTEGGRNLSSSGTASWASTLFKCRAVGRFVRWEICSTDGADGVEGAGGGADSGAAKIVDFQLLTSAAGLEVTVCTRPIGTAAGQPSAATDGLARPGDWEFTLSSAAVESLVTVLGKVDAFASQGREQRQRGPAKSRVIWPRGCRCCCGCGCGRHPPGDQLDGPPSPSLPGVGRAHQQHGTHAARAGGTHQLPDRLDHSRSAGWS